MNNFNSTPPTDVRLLRISPRDNVATAVGAIEPGESVTIDGESVVFPAGLPMGHKVALVPIGKGQKVIKYGAPIGSATCDISPGQCVHTGNLQSDYWPTYTLQESERYIEREE